MQGGGSWRGKPQKPVVIQKHQPHKESKGPWVLTSLAVKYPFNADLETTPIHLTPPSAATMSKRRGPARSSNAASAALGAPSSFNFGFDSPGTFSSSAASQLSYVTEPPDLSSLSDASVVVLFKNLSKKDETTKAKALEDLQTTLAGLTEVEEPVVAAWIRLYPRLSTDTSRRVRQLAHTVHGVIAQRTGKRIAKHMPKVVGAWLAGLYDNDRGTSRAARDALKLVFTSEEKVKSVWRAYHSAILEYCTSVVANESVSSLSDERQVSPGDAESKFARVISTCVLTVGHLITELPEEELTKQASTYQDLFSNPHLWTFAYHADPYLRKSIYKFLQLSLRKRPDLVEGSNLETIANAIIAKSLATPQIGSVTDFLDALVDLTHTLPASWTIIKPPKKRAPIALVIRFVKLGSQTAPPEYWSKVSKLISSLPGEILPTTVEGVRDLLNAIADGIRGGPEPRSHLVAAWRAYFVTCYHLLAFESQQEDVADYIVKEAMLPVYEEYLQSSDEGSRLKIPYYGASICASGIAMAGVRSEGVVNLVREGVWKKVERLMLKGITRDAGEESSEGVKGLGQRWVDLSAEILRKTRPENPVVEIVKESNVDILLQSIDTLVAEKGNSSDVASLLEQILIHFGSSVLGARRAQKATASFFADNLPELLDSPSLTPLLSALVAYGTHITDIESFQTGWEKTIQALLISAIEKGKKESSVIQLLKSTPPNLHSKVPLVPELEHYVGKKLESSLNTDETSGWEIMKSAFHSSAVSEDTTMKMLVSLTNGLSLQEEALASKVCKHLGSVAKQSPAILVSFARSENGAGMLSRLLVLMESSDDGVSAAARSINKAIEQGLASSSTTKGEADRVVGSMVDIISKSVREPEDVELSLHTLAEKARDLINRVPEDERAALVERLLFAEEHWKPALSPFLQSIRNPSLAIANPIGGCIFLIDDDSSDTSIPGSIVRDGQGVSTALRMGIFTIEFLKAMDVFDKRDNPLIDIFSGISEEARSNLLFYLTLTLELAKDNISIAGVNDLWTGNLPEVEMEAEDFVSDAQKFVANCLKEGELAGYVLSVIDRLTEASAQQSTSGFYSARVLAGLISELSEHQKISPEKSQGWLKSVDVRRGLDVFRSTAILTGLSDSLEHHKDTEKLRNELVSDLTGVSVSKAGEEGLRKLIFLNAILPKPGEDTAPLPPQRIIFLIKHLLAWFEDEEFAGNPNLAVITEASKTFASILPAVRELYGEHWQSLCDFITQCWMMCVHMGEQDLPLVFATLKLFQTLRSLRHENDDIEEAWDTTISTLASALIGLLRYSRHGDEQHQPRNQCNTLMARQTKLMELRHIGDPSEIYPLLNVRSRSIQEAAFEILHRHIPSVQEQVSIDAAFSKEDNFQLQLPAELLSLIIEPPNLDEVEDLGTARGMPLALRGYLLTWILIFDHFENSSFKVRSAYVETLKEGGYLTSLLDFTFDFLGHAKGRPIDASRFQIEEYNLDEEENPEKDTQWLLVHLYYLSLRFIPSLAKSWWLDCKARQKVLSVEKFTEKYMSPLIIEKELNSVRTWIQEQPAPAPGEEDSEMQVKISRGAAKEVTAVYPIDDQKMEMVVRLPPTFPLRQVEVEGVRRVGLNEQQFKRMLLASQAVINFQSASIIDGLTLFRKNVSLHFQGIAECAICYSILAVTPDRSLPNKACSTCKNKFHSSCLLKWFKTSNSSSCPLCRTSFSFYA